MKLPFRMVSLAAIVCLCGGITPAQANRPNILLIVADDLGYSDLGCYGSEIDTPNLDALAASGIRLARFYNTGRCCPSRASILTGHYAHRVGLGHMTQNLGRPGYRGRVSKDAKTIAQVLQPRGYRSFIAGKWHLGTDDPTQHGFEEFYGTLVSAKRFWDPDHFVRLPAGRPKRSYPTGSFYGTDAVTDHAIDFLELARKTPDKPWFLYLAYNAPHFPLHARQSDINKYADRYHGGWDEIRSERLQRMTRLGIVPSSTKLTPRSPYEDYGQVNEGTNPAWNTVPEDRRLDLARRMAIYAAMIDAMDQNIGRLFDDLREAQQWHNTLIVFCSDNGACAEWDPWGFDISSSPQNILHREDQLDSMGGPGTFHSVGSGWAGSSNTPWRLYKHYNHEGGINSPCIIHWPAGQGGRPAGSIDQTPTHIIDLLPTFADAAKLALPEQRGELAGVAYAGQSLVPLLRGDSITERRLFFEHEGNRAVIDGPWKLVARRGQAWELYDTAVDRTELNDLAETHGGQVHRLRKLWDAWADANHVTPLPKDYNVAYLRADP